MNWQSIWHALWGTILGGAVLITIAFVIHRLQPKWAGFKALVGLGGAVMASPLIAWAVWAVCWVLTWLLDKLGAWFASFHTKAGTVGSDIASFLGTALPWIIAVILLGRFVIDMYPRFRDAKAAQGVSGKLGAIHAAGHNTLWVAVLLPAAWVVAAAPNLMVGN